MYTIQIIVRKLAWDAGIWEQLRSSPKTVSSQIRREGNCKMKKGKEREADFKVPYF